jgi:lipopolysaccharide biosynthesis glycosyltransferase
MHIVFCCDRKVLAGLHVAAKSVLAHFAGSVDRPVFWVFSDEIDAADLALLRATLDSTGRPFTLHLRSVDIAPLQGFTKLTGSLAAYYRLLVPEQIEADRYLYLDVDTLCRADLSAVVDLELNGHPIALCAECPMTSCADQSVVETLGAAASGEYFNSGVMLVDRNRWREKNVTIRCLDHLSNHRADYWDQSAINCVLHGDIATLPPRFNWYTNVRAHWPALKPPLGGKDRLLHFVDYPKPWSRHGRWLHPFGPNWWNAYRNTAHYRNGPRPDLEVELKSEHWPGYKKAIKDRLLFGAYSIGCLRPKGVPSLSPT